MGKKTFKRSEQNKKIICKKLFSSGDFRPFLSKNAKIWDYFFQLVFPKDFEYLKSLDIGLWEMGAKRL